MGQEINEAAHGCRGRALVDRPERGLGGAGTGDVEVHPGNAPSIHVVGDAPDEPLQEKSREQCAAGRIADLDRRVNEAVHAIKAAYRPEGVNVGFNLGRAAGAGVPTHVHGHVLPRWDADSNFMTTVAEARVLPEPLSVTWTKLREAWEG